MTTAPLPTTRRPVLVRGSLRATRVQTDAPRWGVNLRPVWRRKRSDRPLRREREGEHYRFIGFGESGGATGTSREPPGEW